MRELVNGPFDGHSVDWTDLVVASPYGKKFVLYKLREDGKYYFDKYCKSSNIKSVDQQNEYEI